MTLLRLSAIGAAAALAGSATVACAGADTDPPVATVSFAASRTRLPLGSPVDMTYRFDVSPTASIDGDYRVFVQVKSADGQTPLWQDDHEPPQPTSAWAPGQRIEYTRTHFVPVVPYLGDARVEVGLYRDGERLPLQGPDPADRELPDRSYNVGTLHFLPTSESVFIIYKTGWHPDEFAPNDPAQSWKWTQKSAVFSVRNPRTDVTLYLEYDARPDLFPDEPQQVSVLVGDETVYSFPAASATAELLTIPISAAELGDGDMLDLRLDVDRAFVPAEQPAGGKDTRELGIRVYHAFIESR